MILKINNEDLELKYSFRSSIYFEQITGHSLNFENFTSNDLLTLFYCTVIASLQKAKKPIITMLDFLDKIDDENDGDKCIYEFSKWYIETMKAQYDVNDADLEKEEKKSQE